MSAIPRTTRLIVRPEHGGEDWRLLARSNEMADETPQPMPDIGAIRPARIEDAEPADSTTVTRLLGSADPAFAPGIAAHDTARFTTSGFIASVAHVLVLAAVILMPPGEFGHRGASTDSISVSIVSASAIESRERAAITAAGGASDLVARPGESQTETTAAPDKREEAPPPKREETPPEVEREIAAKPTAPEEPAPETVADALAAPTIATAPPEPETEPKVAMIEPPPPDKREEKPDEKPKEEKPKIDSTTPAQEVTAAGGAPSTGAAQDLPPSAASAAARRGDANAYGLEVQAALMAVDKREARARLAATRAKGTVVLRLVIAGDGALERADIEKSSGHRQLDEAAVHLVRMTAFPRPPEGLSPDQRAYTAPIVFR